jgi:Fe-S-cluster containining protein
MPEPWYQAGLRFSCTQCGHCCTGSPGYVWVDDAELDAIARFRGEKPHETRALFTRRAHRGRTLRERDNGDCTFYSATAGCTIYPVRPRQCRTWPFWESTVATPEAWARTCKGCPGAGQGELISADEITRRLREIQI